MSGYGFDEAKLKRNLDALFMGWTEAGDPPCVQAIVNRYGETAYEGVFGWANLEERKPLQSDAIFRAWSMTKVYTSVCMMMLYERGAYKMHDPLSQYIPEYRRVKVAERDGDGCVSLVPPRREITIRDLFTMASGLPYPGSESPSERAMSALEQRQRQAAKMGKPWGTLRVAREMALEGVPLAFHPGEGWLYGMSIDVLGAVVEVLSGRRLGEFMRENIFEPLGLTDTSFRLPEGKRSRLVTAYEADTAGRFVRPISGERDHQDYFAPEDAFESGGGGLLSTARDMIRFARMLTNRGELDGVRLLSRKSVELMRANHLSPRQMEDYDWDTQRGYGYGLAVRTMLRPELAGYGSVGEFGWDGLMGTWFSADPSERLSMVLMVQTNPGNHYRRVPLFAQAVYGAIAD